VTVNGPLLIVGAEGLLGSALVAQARQRGLEVCATMQQRDDASEGVHRLDLAEPPDAWSPPPCSSAVLCAAVTSLEACRRDPVSTRHINVTQTLRLAERLVQTGAFGVFISSNLVFDGARPCRPAGDTLCPKTEYGRQKAEVERALAAWGDSVAVVRLTKVVSPRWPLLRGWLEALRGGRAIEAFEDMVCAPIPLDLTTRGLLEVARRRKPGIWQFSAAADVSYADLARDLAVRLGTDAGLIRHVSARDRLAPEHLPEHTTLDTSRAVRELGMSFPLPLEAVAAQGDIEAA
jgi:dTDP-4-dehydrorhamnose reductase